MGRHYWFSLPRLTGQPLTTITHDHNDFLCSSDADPRLV